MPTLYIVGLGLGPGDLTRDALEVLAKARYVFMETYTSRAPHTGLVRELRPDVVVLGRRDLEDEGGRAIINALRSGGDAALFVVGDPMIATTHSALVVSVRRLGFSVRIINSVSILCASIGQVGLSPYKLGPVATVTYPRMGVLSDRAMGVLRDNLVRGLHTLLLLDVDDSGNPMRAREAVEILLRLNEKFGLLSEELVIVYLARVGWFDQRIVVSTIREPPDLGETPHSIIVPGYMNPVELEYMVHVLGAQEAHVRRHMDYVKKLMGNIPPE